MFTSKRLVRDIEVDICAATSANYVSSLATVTVKTKWRAGETIWLSRHHNRSTDHGN
jgi:hypothetical protein